MLLKRLKTDKVQDIPVRLYRKSHAQDTEIVEPIALKNNLHACK